MKLRLQLMGWAAATALTTLPLVTGCGKQVAGIATEATAAPTITTRGGERAAASPISQPTNQAGIQVTKQYGAGDPWPQRLEAGGNVLRDLAVLAGLLLLVSHLGWSSPSRDRNGGTPGSSSAVASTPNNQPH